MPSLKYLENYADKTLSLLENIPEHEFVLVIPAYNESDDFIANLNYITSSFQNIFIIIIINYPENSRIDAQDSSENLLQKLLNLGPSRSISAHVRLVNLNNNTLALCGPFALPVKQGVGKARKIGSDWALELIIKNRISTPIIFSTDADALLPKNYFLIGQQNLCDQTSALLFPFSHKKPQDPLVCQAITLYEHRLRHYVQGLKFAGSPYAFHTIGSTIAVRAQSYAQVRGFPIRAAGEDFYILNKLCKVGKIKTLNSSPILLSSRVSDRVPFGTGPALKTILQDNNTIFDIVNNTRIFYHPQVFVILKEFLAYFEHQIMKGSNDFSHAPYGEIFLGLRNSRTLAQSLNMRTHKLDRLKAFHSWFDGFMTLKFIHNLRDQKFAMCSLIELEKLACDYKV